MDLASVLALPSTLIIDRVERSIQGLTISLHATTSCVCCPRCGTAGSRVHSRYTRTVADLTCVGQRLRLKLLVRKWVCPLDSCQERIFAEQFAELARRYARMTDRLVQALQSAGVTSNGADGACLLSSVAQPTTAKTLIRRVLELPLPQEGSVRIAGIDEWAWKKGQTYGTILVDLEQRRVVALLPERSVESSTDWFKKHPEVEVVSRDRGKIFRAAADLGASQAKQIVDRFHLQKNFAQALEKFFGHRKPLLKAVAHQLVGKARAPSAGVPRQTEQERKDRHAERVRRQKKIWKLYRAGYRKEDIAQMVGVGSRSVYRALEHEQPPARRTRHCTHHITDPYLPYLTREMEPGVPYGSSLVSRARGGGDIGGRCGRLKRSSSSFVLIGPNRSLSKRSPFRTCRRPAMQP